MKLSFNYKIATCAVACTTNYHIIMADESTAELDSKMGLQVMKSFKDLVDKGKITVILTTHDSLTIVFAHHDDELEDGKIV